MAWQSLQQIVVNKKSLREISIKVICLRLAATAMKLVLLHLIHSIYFAHKIAKFDFSIEEKSLLLPLFIQSNVFHLIRLQCCSAR
jgi:hypothetical protein